MRPPGRFSSQLVACHEELSAGLEPDLEDRPLRLPLIGTVGPDDVSLPVFTVAVAALDAFNPCAFFVLLFLLSLLVHARSRARMAVIGGIFVLFSGLIYFVLTAAWLNVFVWVGRLRIITAIAGVVALTLAAVNIKDFFVTGVGPSLSIREEATAASGQRYRSALNTVSLLTPVRGWLPSSPPRPASSPTPSPSPLRTVRSCPS